MFYELKAEGASNDEWNAILVADSPPNKKILEELSNNFRIELSEPIHMLLVNMYSDTTQRKVVPFHADLVYWKDDITLQAFRPSKGTHVIISPALKKIFDNFAMPDHEYYPVKLSNYDSLQQVKDYYLLQIFGSLITSIDFTLSEYTYTERSTNAVTRTQKGGFDNFEQFKRVRSELLMKGALLGVKRMVLRSNYDIVWGFNNSILINEAVKSEVEMNKLVGISIDEFTSYEIVLQR